MTVSEEFIPTEEEQEGGGGILGIKLTPQIIGIAIAVLGIAASAALYFYLLQPALEQQAKLQTDIQTKQQEIEALKRGAAGKAEAQATLAREIQLRSEVSTLFGDAKTLDTLLFDINKIVKAGGAKLNLFNKKPNSQEKMAAALFPKVANNLPSTGPMGDRFQGMSIPMELEGSFAQTQSILRNIERLEPLILVDDKFMLALNEDRTEVNNLAVEVDAQGKVIRLTDPSLKTTVNLLVIVPKSPETFAAMQKAAAEAEKNKPKPK